jgi:hypothetical protein
MMLRGSEKIVDVALLWLFPFPADPVDFFVGSHHCHAWSCWISCSISWNKSLDSLTLQKLLLHPRRWAVAYYLVVSGPLAYSRAFRVGTVEASL